MVRMFLRAISDARLEARRDQLYDHRVAAHAEGKKFAKYVKGLE